MSSRLLDQGPDATFESLTAELKAGETLVATWVRDGTLAAHASPVTSAGRFEEVVRNTESGYYYLLRFHATDDDPPSDDYFAYGA